MMRHNKILTFIFSLLLCNMYSFSTKAVVKLDFFKLPESITNQIESLKNEVQDKMNTNTQDANTKQKGDNAEGKALWNQMKGRALSGLGNIDLKSVATSIVKGDFNFNSISSQFMSGAGLNNLSLDVENMANLYMDYQQEVVNVRAAKNIELTQKEADLQAMLIAEKDEEKRAEIQKALEVVRAEKKYNQAKLDEKEAKHREAMARIDEARQAINQAMGYVDRANIDQKIYQGIDDLFKEEEESDSQNEVLYGKSINDFFLGTLEYENSKNVDRISKNRDKEYYKSFQKALKSVVDTKVYSTNVQDQSDACAEVSTGVDTIHGAMSMRICEDIQTAKTASMFTKMLLAEIKLMTTSEIIGWNDKFKLKDYGKDITSFDMDDYVLKKTDLLADQADNLLSKGTKKLDEFSF